MTDREMIIEIAKVLNECCGFYDEKGVFLRNKCNSHDCEFWCDTNYVCCSYNDKQATALYNAGYRKIPDGAVVLKKEEYEKLFKDGFGIMTSHIGELEINPEGMRKAVDEIARLIRVQNELQVINAKYYNEAKDLRRNMRILRQASHSIEEVNYKTEEAKKETAREILIKGKQLVEKWLSKDDEKVGFLFDFEEFIKKQFGVEIKENSMERELVKDIKEALASSFCPYIDYVDTIGEPKMKRLGLRSVINIIKELESENERLKDEVKVRKGFIEDYKIVCDKKDKENKQLKDRIAELEKENVRLDKVVKHNQELIENGKLISSEQLKQFAERLKEKATWSFIMCGDHKAGAKTVTLHDIDETLKEKIEDDKQ